MREALRSLFSGLRFSSGQYWSERYRSGGNSGEGSYGKLAAYKAQFLNDFAREHQVASVIEFGCGDGAQAELFEFKRYTGIDVAPEAVEICRAKHGARDGWVFHDLADANAYRGRYDLALSLDVIYHLTEDQTYERYMRTLFDHAEKHVLVYASDTDKRTMSRHVRHRCHSDWVGSNAPDWQRVAAHENPLAGSGRDRSFAFFTHYARTPA